MASTGSVRTTELSIYFFDWIIAAVTAVITQFKFSNNIMHNIHDNV